MSQSRRVAWGEGLLLTPQHLQQAERSVRHEIASRFRLAHPEGWGLTSIRIDPDALRNGRFSLVEASGVLPDGTPFSMPGDDPLPAESDLGSKLDSRQTQVVVQLGLPLDSGGRRLLGAAAPAGGAGPRFVPDEIDVEDVTTEKGGRRAVAVMRPAPSLLFPNDALGDYSALPVARVKRTPQGGFELDPEYIPPLLAIGASERLMAVLRRWFEKLVSLGTELGKRRGERGSTAGFASADAGAFWRLHTVNAHLPALAHLLEPDHRQRSPEAAYLALASLAGALCTFHMKLHPKDLAPYRHADLTETFAKLDAQLVELTQLPDDTTAIPLLLESAGPSQWRGEIRNELLLAPTTRLYLGVRTDVDEPRLIADLPSRAIVSTVERLREKINFALGGVPLVYDSRPPATIPFRTGFVYFQIEARGEDWEAICAARNLGLFLPLDYPAPTVEVWGIPA